MSSDQASIVWSYATENFPVQFSWKQFFAMIFKLMVNFKTGDTWEVSGSEEKIRVEPVAKSYKSKRVWTSHWLDSYCENSDFLFRATCVII